ncbi:hypothetical protein FI667_g13648, partial [Globisporangium splendens]
MYKAKEEEQMGMKVAASGASSVRAKHTRLALSKALNVTINRAPMQASLRKMLKKTKGGKDHGDLLQGFFNDDGGDGVDGASGSSDAAAENTKADEALAQVILGVCEDTETHFESLVQEKHVNAEFDALDAWIQEAQETLLRKRARAEANGYATCSATVSQRSHSLFSNAFGQTDDEEHQEIEIDAKLISPELLVLAERQRVVNEELQQLQKLRVQKAAQLAQVEKTVEFARRAALSDIDKAQHAVAQVDSVRDLVKDYASFLTRWTHIRERERKMELYEDDHGNMQPGFQGDTMMTHTSMSLTGLSMSSFASDYGAGSSTNDKGDHGDDDEQARLELSKFSTSLLSNEGNGDDQCENNEAVDPRSPRTAEEEKSHHDDAELPVEAGDEGEIGRDGIKQKDDGNAEGDGDAQMESESMRDAEKDQRMQDIGESDSDNSAHNGTTEAPVHPVAASFLLGKDFSMADTRQNTQQLEIASMSLPQSRSPIPAPASGDASSLEIVVTAKQGEVRCAVSDHEDTSPAPPLSHAIPPPPYYTLRDLFPVVFEEKQTHSCKKTPSQAPNERPSAATSATKPPPPASTSKAPTTKSDAEKKQLALETTIGRAHSRSAAHESRKRQTGRGERAESCHADETQAQAVQTQLSLTQLKARVHVLQTRNNNVETQLEKLQVELRTCKQELRRKTATVHATAEKLTKAETEMNHMKNRHTRDMLQWKTKLVTMQQKWDVDTAKRDREVNLKMTDALRDAKAQAGTTLKKNAALEARVLQLEDELKHSKRGSDARQRDLLTQVNQVRTLERLLHKCHRTEAILHNDVASLQANAKSASNEKCRVDSNEMGRGDSQKSRRSKRQDASLFPLDLLLLPADSDSDDGDERLCTCGSESLVRRSSKDVAVATEPSRCLECDCAASQLCAAQTEIQRLRLLHSKELNVQATAFTRALSSRSQPSSGSANSSGRGGGIAMSELLGSDAVNNGVDTTRLSSTSSA